MTVTRVEKRKPGAAGGEPSSYLGDLDLPVKRLFPYTLHSTVQSVREYQKLIRGGGFLLTVGSCPVLFGGLDQMLPINLLRRHRATHDDSGRPANLQLAAMAQFVLIVEIRLAAQARGVDEGFHLLIDRLQPWFIFQFLDRPFGVIIGVPFQEVPLPRLPASLPAGSVVVGSARVDSTTWCK